MKTFSFLILSFLFAFLSEAHGISSDPFKNFKCKSCSRPETDVQVYGKYDVKSNTLFITSSQSDLYSNAVTKAFGVKLSGRMLSEQFHLSRVT